MQNKKHIHTKKITIIRHRERNIRNGIDSTHPLLWFYSVEEAKEIPNGKQLQKPYKIYPEF